VWSIHVDNLVPILFENTLIGWLITWTGTGYSEKLPLEQTACHVRYTKETKVQRGKHTFFFIIRTNTEQMNKITKRIVKLIWVGQTGN
jgi:hypothetical protein